MRSRDWSPFPLREPGPRPRHTHVSQPFHGCSASPAERGAVGPRHSRSLPRVSCVTFPFVSLDVRWTDPRTAQWRGPRGPAGVRTAVAAPGGGIARLGGPAKRAGRVPVSPCCLAALPNGPARGIRLVFADGIPLGRITLILRRPLLFMAVPMPGRCALRPVSFRLPKQIEARPGVCGARAVSE